jgi:hypothetical protein
MRYGAISVDPMTLVALGREREVEGEARTREPS